MQQVSLNSIGEPGDFAKMFIYLDSDESTFVTGTEMEIDCGAYPSMIHSGIH